MKRVYLFALLLVLGACQDDRELAFALTPATQTGANTLSFQVDGRVFQPYGRRCFGFGGGPCIEEPLTVRYTPRTGAFDITAFLTTKTRAEYFALSCDSVFRPRAVSAYSPHAYGSAGLGYSADRNNYVTFDPRQTEVGITRLDTVAHIVSGTFKGYLQNLQVPVNQQHPSVLLTDGRFDVAYQR